MSTIEKKEYFCDRCDKKLKTYANHLDIMTDLNDDEWANPWSRLHVKIEHHHGYHNDAEVENADLCKECVIFLLTDALKRVKAGERVSKGVDAIEMLKWNQPF